MKKIIILIVTILLTSCKSYLDRGENISNDFMNFNYMKDYNEFIYKSKINSITDTKTYYKNYFTINLPKKLKHWQILDNKFYFEYDGKEVIYINSGYKNEGNLSNWILRETDSSEIYDLLNSYWDERKYNEDLLILNKLTRTSKVYSDGKVLILLYNIKQDNLNKYLKLVKNFKYIN